MNKKQVLSAVLLSLVVGQLSAKKEVSFINATGKELYFNLIASGVNIDVPNLKPTEYVEDALVVNINKRDRSVHGNKIKELKIGRKPDITTYTNIETGENDYVGFIINELRSRDDQEPLYLLSRIEQPTDVEPGLTKKEEEEMRREDKELAEILERVKAFHGGGGAAAEKK